MKRLLLNLLLIPSPAFALTCEQQAAAGLIPAFYCNVTNAPAGEAYPTGTSVQPLTGPDGVWPKECNICGGQNELSEATSGENCVPYAEYSEKKCNALLTYKPLMDIVAELTAEYDAAATSSYQLWDENQKLKACNECLRTARNRRNCKC